MILVSFANFKSHGESDDRPEHSDFLLLPQKDPFGELFSENLRQ